MHLLDAPPVLGELGCQPVEQFRMRRRFALAAEIIRSFHESLAEMSLPDPVYHHTAQQRIIRRRQPEGQSLTALRYEEDILRFLNGWTGIESGEVAGLDFFSLLLEIAPNENVRIRHDLFMRQDV